ncbi:MULTISPECIES: protocatechuate 3,4-dioxygenase [unclassified Burkholderia]|uniref:DODA-type extradiol aromatic ring-opening family dioxygenase n=1 Tax=unclassified Burkholderia TaxID=2613784 RepID=UPI000F56D69C|nr:MULTISPECIES: protocatechuate 3,4-dioxygenase [unclassified Burkholderia]RQR68765.1 protocatechuate 3,4-dioxygenase [Burkholderia sp. Bp9012]RQR70273.1 protocatechuate 3,4-dioxygenase [Burkholderia sp. Bp9011]RQR83019.1 protocatechuate 3,4-dioxygenase [Burkholderia sp. Bp9010]RQZ39428.1 protocatechuate 3,4-dioxygenase [Burkholderia sp. Bp9099]
MAKMVGGFLVPHDPVMFVTPEAPAQPIRERMWNAFDTCAERLAVLRPTSVVIVGADHYMLFGTQCLPSFLIGTGDVDGPLDALPGLKRGVIPDSAPLAQHIAEHGLENGFDWAVARALTVDHSVGIPNLLIVQPLRDAGMRVGTIPVYLAAGVDPYIRLSRAVSVGYAIRAAVEAWPADERVAVIGSGGLSHWVGTAEMGRVNETFDREILDYATRGDADALARLSDAYILENGGNGGMEIRNWACAMGALAGARGEVIDYAPVPEWVTGLGFVQLHLQ